MKISQLVLSSILFTPLCTTFAGEKITLNIQGNQELFSRLGKLNSVKKDDFEKTTVFANRLCEQTYKALGISEHTLITIGLEPIKIASQNYFADKEAFEIRLGNGGNYFDAGRDYNDEFKWNTDIDRFNYYSFNIASEYKESTNSYSGTNAFGASKNVKIGTETATVLYIHSKTRLKDIQTIVLKSKPEEARRIRDDLRIAIITHLSTPCFVSGHGHKSPTMDYAYDLTISEGGIVGAPNPEWVIYLDSTKEILKRGKFQN
jgi:hypothetical protein